MLYDTIEITLRSSRTYNGKSGSPNPFLDVNSQGNLDSIGKATITWKIPSINGLSGQKIYASAITLDYSKQFPETVSSVFPSIPISIISISNLQPTRYELKGNLQENDLIYTDRTYTYTNIPSFLLGADYIKTANNDKRNLSVVVSFYLSLLSDVYVLYDTRVYYDSQLRPDWTAGFTDTGIKFNGGTLLKKSFQAGKVTLGANARKDPGPASSMYTVIVD